jgi:hypothetical protein
MQKEVNLIEAAYGVEEAQIFRIGKAQEVAIVA